MANTSVSNEGSEFKPNRPSSDAVRFSEANIAGTSTVQLEVDKDNVTVDQNGSKVEEQSSEGIHGPRPSSVRQAHPEWSHMRVGVGGTHLEHRHSQRYDKGERPDVKVNANKKRPVTPHLMGIPIGIGLLLAIGGVIVFAVTFGTGSIGTIIGAVLLAVGVVVIIASAVACIVLQRRLQQFSVVHYQTNQMPVGRVTSIDSERDNPLPRPETQYYTNPESGPQINYSFSQPAAGPPSPSHDDIAQKPAQSPDANRVEDDPTDISKAYF